MVFKRSSRRKNARKPRSRKIRMRTAKRSAVTVNNKMQTHYFKRKCFIANLSPSTLGDNPYSASFNLGQLNGVSDFTNLFDQYTIKAVKLHFIPFYTSSEPAGSSSVAIPNIHYVVDYDDAVNFSNLGEALEYGNVKIRPMNKAFSVYFKPKVLTEIYRSGISTAYAPKSNVKLDMADTGVPHYGFKAIMNQVASSTWQMRLYATIYFSCHNTR